MTNPTGGAPPASSPQPSLTGAQRFRVEQARVLASAEADDLSDGFRDIVDPRNRAMVYKFALDVTQKTVEELLEIIDALTGGGK